MARRRNPNESIEQKIIKKYGFKKQFIKAYISKLVDNNEIIAIESSTKTSKQGIANYFELTSDNFKGKNSGYAKLLSDLLGIHMGFIYNGNLEQDMILAIEHAHIGEKNKSIIFSKYGVSTPKKTYDKLGIEYGVSRARIGQIVNRQKEKIVSTDFFRDIKKKILMVELFGDFLIDVLDLEDIIITDSDGNNSGKREKVFFKIMAKKIDFLTLGNPRTYLSRIKFIENEIQNDTLFSDENKKELMNLLRDKKEKIANHNRAKILEIANERISTYKLNNAINRKITRIDFSKNPYKTFIHNGITNIGELIQHSMRDISLLDGIQNNQLGEVFRKLESFGFSIPNSRNRSIAEYNELQPDIFKTEEQYIAILADEITNLGFDEDTTKVLLSNLELEYKELIRNGRAEGIEYFEREMTKNVKNKKMKITVEELEFPPRVVNAFNHKEIVTLKDVLELSKRDIHKMSNIGTKAANSIFEIIESLGYDIPDDMDTTIYDNNKYKIRYENRRIDAGKIADKIQNSGLDEVDKGLLLDKLYIIAVFNLQELYQELDIEAERYRELITLADVIPDMGIPTPVQESKKDNERELERITEVQETIKNELDALEEIK